MDSPPVMPRIVAIGTSAGGCAALNILIPSLDDLRQAAYVIIQHSMSDSPSYLPDMLAEVCTMQVTEALDKVALAPGHIYTAPPGYHLYVEQDGRFSLSVDRPECYSRPSINVFFDSLAHAAKEMAIGILLTGANQDGAEGLHHLKLMGGITIVQDPADAEFPAMPQAAIHRFTPDVVCSLPEISTKLKNILERPP